MRVEASCFGTVYAAQESWLVNTGFILGGSVLFLFCSYGSAGGVNENLDNGEQDGTEDEVEFVSKRPRLTVDTSINCQPLCEALSSSESFMSSSQGGLSVNHSTHSTI